ncbi:MAG: hypothetical protein HY043_15165 [Verrucomicrobia bacterium]|nr:hypothetical protein [Verrucomicrobiota bacterium]
MATKVSPDLALNDAAGIEKVWKANPTMTLGKDDQKVTIADFQAVKQDLSDRNEAIEELRHQLNGLLDQRDDVALKLNGYNTRALSAIRGIFGPDSPEYDQAGGTRTSERKKPVRQSKKLAAAA